MPSKRPKQTEQPRGKHAAAPGAQTTSNTPSVRDVAAETNIPQQSSAQHMPAPGYPERTRTPLKEDPGKVKRKKKKKQKKRRVPLAVKIVIALIIVAALAVGAFLVWDHLFRYDDEADIQGQWKIEGSNNSIVITEDEIRLTDSVSFGYELNTFEKTITYYYVNYSGEGRYEFSDEREVLTLTDISPEPDEGDEQQSMSLLKVSNEAVGEPESANNNTTVDASSYGADVVDGSMSAEQAERDNDTNAG